MTPVLQVGATMVTIAVGYAIILAASTAAFVFIEEGAKMTKISRKILDEVGDQISAESRAAICRIDAYEAKIAKLEEKVAQLEASRGQSPEPPGQKPEPEE